MTAALPSITQLASDGGPSAFFRALDRLNARDAQVCDEAEIAADNWDHDEWWLP